MTSLHQTYSTLANILSDKNNIDELLNDIKKDQIDWINLVKVSSEHLVLTTVFCKLKEKELLQLIPKDLKDYLQELTAINRNRNQDLLNEIKNIALLFNEKNIDYVFLKGAALLTLGYYNDLGERMVGDIDVLIEESQIPIAKIALEHNGYKSVKPRLSDKYLEKRHIPRLVNKEKLAAVEIHSQLLKKKHATKLKPSTVLTNSQDVGGILFPNDIDLLKHAILGVQINDLGNYFNSIHFKHIYDSLILINRNGISALAISSINKKHFIYGSIYFDDFSMTKSNLKDKVCKNLFRFRMKHQLINKIWNYFLRKIWYLMTIVNRTQLFITNSNYRKDVLLLLKKV